MRCWVKGRGWRATKRQRAATYPSPGVWCRSRCAAGLAVAIAVGACATDDPNRRAKIGAAGGAAAGAAIGYAIGEDAVGALLGATAGALTGGLVGNYMDRQQREMERVLAEERRRHEVEIERLKDDTLKLNLSSEVSFDYDSAALKPAFYPTLDKLADVIGKYDRTAVHVVGHTDSTGSEAYNQALSERRARSVERYLVNRATPFERIRTYGLGETAPRATNATEAGRQLNRRVEIFLKPIVEGREAEALAPEYL